MRFREQQHGCLCHASVGFADMLRFHAVCHAYNIRRKDKSADVGFPFKKSESNCITTIGLFVDSLVSFILADHFVNLSN